jgi:chorismate mutase
MSRVLGALGEELKAVDQGIMNLIARRLDLAYKVGVYKYLQGEPISRPTVEDTRITAVSDYAVSLGINPHLAAALLYLLIDESCKHQMQALQRGTLLQENIMKLEEYGVETRLVTKIGTMKAVHLNPLFLSPKDREYVFEAVYPIAMNAFGQPHSDKLAHDVRVHVLDHKNLLIVQDGDTNIAFAAWDMFEGCDSMVIYLAGICVTREYQQHIAGRSMVEHIVRWADQAHAEWSHFALRTQNWAMHRCIEGLARVGRYQRFGDESIDPDLQAVGSFVARQINDPYFEPDKLVSRKIYGACLYGAGGNLVSYPGLDHAAGDAAYCLWCRQ